MDIMVDNSTELSDLNVCKKIATPNAMPGNTMQVFQNIETQSKEAKQAIKVTNFQKQPEPTTT